MIQIKDWPHFGADDIYVPIYSYMRRIERDSLEIGEIHCCQQKKLFFGTLVLNIGIDTYRGFRYLAGLF